MHTSPMYLVALIVTLTLHCLSSAQAGVIPLAGGTEGGTQLQNQTRFVIDLGFYVPSLPTNPNRVLFEAGGNGDGTAITLIDNEIVVYLDFGGSTDFLDDTTFVLDVSSFAGSIVSIRLQGDYSTTSDTVQLDVFNGSSTLSTGVVNLNSDYTTPAGGDAFGTGGRGGNSFPGFEEADGTGGTPDMNQFHTSIYDISENGANVLGPDFLQGTLYTGITDSDNALAGGIPDPSSWGVVPEPSSLALLMSTSLLWLLRRRKQTHSVNEA